MSLPAVILVGGQGTRLRPLTDRTRKDMLPLVENRIGLKIRDGDGGEDTATRSVQIP